MHEHGALQALELARASVFEACLLGIGLPEIDGTVLARRLRAMPETTQAILVALTGYGQAEDRQRAHKAGFDHHMAKPADLAKLLELLASVGSAASVPTR